MWVELTKDTPATHKFCLCQTKKSCGPNTKTCQKPYKFDLEVKVQVRIGIMNVLSYSKKKRNFKRG